MASMTSAMAAYYRLARHNRNFRRLWLAQIVSEIGDWFYVVAIYSLLLELTGKASSVALALVLQVLPQAFFGPIAGIINDRLRRKQVMIFADLARAVIVAAMLLVRSRELVWRMELKSVSKYGISRPCGSKRSIARATAGISLGNRARQI